MAPIGADMVVGVLVIQGNRLFDIAEDGKESLRLS